MMELLGDCYKARLRIFCSFVWDLRTLSKCKDRQVSCIICSEDLQQIYSIGVNGSAKGYKEDCLCKTDSKYTCVHAEANALVKLRTDTSNKILICSLMPCCQCASMIANTPGGFSAILWIQDWKEHDALDIFQSAGIKAGKLHSDGTIEWYVK